MENCSDSEYFECCEGTCESFGGFDSINEQGNSTELAENGTETQENAAIDPLENVLNSYKDEAEVTVAEPDIVEEEQSRWEMEELLTEEEKGERLNRSQSLKAEGNSSFGLADYSSSIDFYTQALSLCPLFFSQERSIYLCNRAAAHLKNGDYESGVADCNSCLALDPDNLKAVHRRACCYEQNQQHLHLALEDYEKMLKENPNNKSVKDAIQRLKPKIAERDEKMKEEMMGKLKDLGNTFLRPFGLSTDNFKMEPQEGGGYSLRLEK